MERWHELKDPQTRWLVDGLFPADGDSAIAGKPKAGKSTLIRNLIACVIKSKPFLGRAVNIPAGKGKVLYIHLDRKDRPGRVAAELKHLGINSPDEVSRLNFVIATDLPSSLEERMQWLSTTVKEFKPNLIVIDLMLQFVEVRNSNDYNQTLTAINSLQDVLADAGNKGALVGSFHARKSPSMDNPADDVLGSTAIRGSFGTLVILSQQRLENRYSIMSDQTDREEPWGEIDSTEILRNPDGTMSLGATLYDLKKQAKDSKDKELNQRVLLFIDSNPGVSMDQLVTELRIAKGRLINILGQISPLICSSGEGVRGDPRLYSTKLSAQVEPAEPTTSIQMATGGADSQQPFIN